MIIIIHTSTPGGDLRHQLGRPEYSYRFVVEEFRPLLQELGTIIEVTDPEHEVDAIYADCQRNGESCVFLCFLPPNKAPFGLACPTIPVFAWEYDTPPNEAFGGKPRNDWTRVLGKLGSALTHSSFTVERVHDALGSDFPVCSVPAPLWNRMQTLRAGSAGQLRLPANSLLVDSRHTDLGAYRMSLIEAALPDLLPMPERAGEQDLVLDGVIYTSIYNPHDGRKNWMEMITGFCDALRDKADATLLIKLTHHDPRDLIPNMLEAIYKMGSLACRVVLLHAYLPPAEYNTLLRSSTYAVNTSHGEGQCLPLMEYMSAGKPAVAPRHTAMLDYLTPENAFIVDSSPEPGTWPHDQRQVFRTLRQRVHYQALVRAYRCSYQVARHEPEVYAAMSAAATMALQHYCSMEVVRPRLQQFVNARLSVTLVNTPDARHVDSV